MTFHVLVCAAFTVKYHPALTDFIVLIRITTDKGAINSLVNLYGIHGKNNFIKQPVSWMCPRPGYAVLRGKSS